jgi:hypothetical protein
MAVYRLRRLPPCPSMWENFLCADPGKGIGPAAVGFREYQQVSFSGFLRR